METELLTLFMIAVLLIVFIWIRNNVRFSDNCPKCGNNVHVKRVPRSFITKYFLFMLNTRRLRCDKCWRFFYQIFPG